MNRQVRPVWGVFMVMLIGLLGTIAMLLAGLGTMVATAAAPLIVGAALPMQITATPMQVDSPTPAPTPILIAFPTNTPRVPSNATPATATPSGNAAQILIGRLCADCNRVRLRATPGTAGEILGVLELGSRFYLIGRTQDNKWLQILTIPGNIGGWVSAAFVQTETGTAFARNSLDPLPVQGTAIEASPTPTSAFLASVGVPGYISGLSATARRIYQRGQQMGNRANVFSKVGDSITAAAQFLYPIGYGQYNLGSYGSLSGVIGFFGAANARAGNSFTNTSLAAVGGWTADKLLWPGNGYTEVCGSEIPLVCEYKLVRPAVALIMIGTNDSGSGAAGVYADQLRQIVQITIDMGIVPVLSTIPPKNFDGEQDARVDQWNQIIRATAAQFDIPLWDYYGQMVGLPNRGMSSDGLHPSVQPDGLISFTDDGLRYGYTVRNLGALQALDAVWRLVMN